MSRSYLAPVSNNETLGTHIFNVTFEPGCRNNWHRPYRRTVTYMYCRPGILSERDKTARELLPGDVVEIAPDAVHWHGAAPDSWFSHLAVECNSATNKNIWFEPVNDEQYLEATAKP
ncbi:MAG: cupin domain-containing protein [Barnesiella sp.]